MEDLGRFITTKDVAAICGVAPKTVARWAAKGKITAYKTLGGHRRFREADARKCALTLEQPKESVNG